MKLDSFTLALSLAALTVIPAVASDAHAQACGMGDVDFYGTERVNVSRAEDLLMKGEPEKAAEIVQRTWPRMREATPVASSLPVIVEGVRVMALAAVRSDGNLRSELGWSSWTPEERAANVRWGVSRLRMIAATMPYAMQKTDLAEALSRSVATRGEGREMLELLDLTNSIASAEGYAALALVRGEAGDPVGADLASRACVKLASNVGAQCEALFPTAPAATAAR